MSLRRVLCPVMLSLLTLPLAAAVRKRAVQTLPTATITGVVRDVAGNPVPGAIVSSGSAYSNRNGTAKDGKYTLVVPNNRPTTITVTDFAFDSQGFLYSSSGDATLDLTLTSPHPTVTVKMTNGDTHVLDIGTSQFAYLVVFSGYAKSDVANFCKPDGTDFKPAKGDVAKIVGPASSAPYAPCCSLGPTLMVNVEMKSGEKTAAYFRDACLGNEVDFVGREPSSGTWQYLRFTDIAEIDFP